MIFEDIMTGFVEKNFIMFQKWSFKTKKFYNNKYDNSKM